MIFEIQSILNKYPRIKDYTRAIYKGGSSVDPVLNNPHDCDYIWFATTRRKSNLLIYLRDLGFLKNSSNSKITTCKQGEKEYHLDFSQVRGEPYTQITWFSYLDVLMEKVVGEDCCPKTDIITTHRLEFYKCLYEKMIELQNGRIKNQKRWYHLLRGIYILINNSYEVTKEQKREINILHQLATGWESIRDKTIDLITNFKV